MIRINIADGINLNIIDSDKFKTNLLKINFTIPLSENTAPYASLLGQVLRRGCAKYPTMTEFNRRLEYLYATSLGSSSTKVGENQLITFGASFLRDEFVPDGTELLSLVCEIMVDCVFSPYLVDGKFSEEYVEGEKKNLCDRIDAEINNKGAYANKRLFEIMCEGEPYAVSPLGTVESVNKISAKSLTEFYFDAFAKAPIEVFFVGTCDKDALTMALKEKLSPFARKATGYCASIVKESAKEIKRVCEEMPVNQGKLAMGFRCGADISKKNVESCVVFNEIFGGSPISKLFENVREKMSLCYYCSSRFISQKGIINIASGVKVGDERKAEDEIMRQLDAMKKGEFSENDIAEAKLSLSNSYISCYDDAERLSSFYLTRIVSGADISTLEEIIARINATTKEEITEIANTVVLDTVYFLKGTNLDGGSEDEE